jgi:hypothetical protein
MGFCTQEGVSSQVADSNIAVYYFDNKLQKMFLTLAHSALRVSLRVVARAQNFQACYEVTRIRLLPSVVVPLHQ